MYHSWLDRWDERRAAEGDKTKSATAPAVGAHLAFPGAAATTPLHGFAAQAANALKDPDFFALPAGYAPHIERDGTMVRFPSSVSTGVAENDLVWADMTETAVKDHALIVLHHWNASRRNTALAKLLSKRGISVVQMALPYHLERARPNAPHADGMLSANLGRTVQSMRQAVLDTRHLVAWLRGCGYGQISVLGMSLGSWVAGLAAAQEPLISRAALFLTAGSLADMVWTGRATRHIRASLAPSIDLDDLRAAWVPLNLEHHAEGLARPGLRVQMTLAKRDTVVLPGLTEQFLQALHAKGQTSQVHRLNCGHYSLGRPPHALVAGFALARFLKSPI